MREALWHIFLMLSFALVCGCGALGLLKLGEILDRDLARQYRERQLGCSLGEEER